MLRVVRERLKQGHRTIPYPRTAPSLPELFRGAPRIDASRCTAGCRECVRICPQQAIDDANGILKLDLGKCVFCGECAAGCESKALTFSNDFRLSVASWEDLAYAVGPVKLAKRLDSGRLSLLGRSLKLRQVSAGGCNACEADLNVLGTVVFDMGRFGVQFVASPRHADGILVTGPVTRNMREALLETYEAMPGPKIVIASGSCAISGGPYRDSPGSCNGVGGLLDVDLFIPGCPPHPLTALDGILRLLGKVPSS